MTTVDDDELQRLLKSALELAAALTANEKGLR